MLLERLEVSSFGRLSAFRLELAPRVTVLLGDNESGKTTICRTLRAALYGVDAGGQGRPVVASDWTRWSPWGGGDVYGLTLVYSTADGRRFRVVRRFEQREQSAQVHEMGGRDITDVMRAGRSVVPGQIHLGIEEAVFCATAWLGEESLRADAPDGAAARADRLQEAIERLADSASRATAAEALGRLRHAMDRVGTENRLRSPLGAATTRLRQLDAELARARQAAAALGAEQDRLVELEYRAADAERRRREAECAWLVRRLETLRMQRREVAAAVEEAMRLEAHVNERQAFTTFPLQKEELVIGLGGELRQAIDAEALAAARWETAGERLREIERRRAEVATSIAALGDVPRIDDKDIDECRRLSEQVAAETGASRRADAVRAAEARLAAVRREIASTGLGSVPVGSADAIAELIGLALSEKVPVRRLRPVAAAVALLGALLAAGAWTSRLVPLAIAILGATVAVVAGLLGAQQLGGGPAMEARRQLGRRCPGLDLSEAGLVRALQRMDDLRRLHADVVRQETVAEAGRAELEQATERIADLSQTCMRLAGRLRVQVPQPGRQPRPSTRAEDLLERARGALRAIEGAAEAGRRRADLEDEDVHLLREEQASKAVGEDAAHATEVRTAIAERLAHELQKCGLGEAARALRPQEGSDPDPAGAVASFRQACATRRQLDTARDRLIQVRRRIQSLGGGDDAALARQEVSLEAELRRRGAEPPPPGAASASAEPLDANALARLEAEAELTRGTATTCHNEATALRERLAGALGALPAIADLEDERAACLAVRDRALRQLGALRRASALIEEAARKVHRDFAPRLAASVGRRLALLTEGRYEEINVDAERFAVSLRPPERPELIPIELLSHGTRDQVSLLLRVALTEVLGEAGEPVPLLLDDPLLSADPRRRRAAVEFLLRLSEHTQVVLTTAEPAIADQVAREGGEGCAVVRLGAPSRAVATVSLTGTGSAAAKAVHKN